MEDLPVHDLLPNRDLLDGTIAEQDNALRDLQVARRHHRVSIQALEEIRRIPNGRTAAQQRTAVTAATEARQVAEEATRHAQQQLAAATQTIEVLRQRLRAQQAVPVQPTPRLMPLPTLRMNLGTLDFSDPVSFFKLCLKRLNLGEIPIRNQRAYLMASMNVDDNNWMDANLDMAHIDESADQVELYNRMCIPFLNGELGQIRVSNERNALLLRTTG
jgi:hypothetical protein